MSAFHTNPIIEKQANIGAVFWATVTERMEKNRITEKNDIEGRGMDGDRRRMFETDFYVTSNN